MPVFTPDELEERHRVFKTFIVRGLVIVHRRSDGTADLEFPQPDHPEIIAFDAEGDAAMRRYEGRKPLTPI